MIPHERSLVEKLSDKSFALIGVNTDQSLEFLKENLKKEGVTWRSFYDGGTGGPICTKWNIRGFPTIFIIDHEGTIRYRDVRGAEMEEAVEKLMAEMNGSESKDEK